MTEALGRAITRAEEGLLDAMDRALLLENRGLIHGDAQLYTIAVAAAMTDPRTRHLFDQPAPPRDEEDQ